MPSPPSNDEIHLTTLRQLERHCRSESKHAGYERLLVEFGIDVERFASLVEHPRLVLAEQPGSWYCGGDLMRYRLLRSLTETGLFHRSSGVLSLASDAFTCRGIKRLFFLLQLHPQLEPVHLIGAASIRRHRNRVYSALPIAGSTFERLAAILDTSLAMLSSAQISPDAFAEELLEIFRGGVRSGIRRLLPPRSDRRGLREFGVRLRDYDLEAARRPLAAARRELREGISWADYWDRANGGFLGTRIGDLGGLFNRFLLTVSDPVRMSRHLMRCCGHPPEKPIAVAAIIAGDGKYRMVFFDPQESRFFYRPRALERRDIGWSGIRELAAGGRTGGPTGTLEYLMMAASGLYLVADPGDGSTRFERQAREIHRRYTGLDFPYVALAAEREWPRFDYLGIYESDFESRSREAIERFFGGRR